MLEQSDEWTEIFPRLRRPTGLRLQFQRLKACLHWPFKQEVNQNSIRWILCILLSV